MIRPVCHSFLVALILVSSLMAGRAFLTHQWDSAAAYAALMFSAINTRYLLLLLLSLADTGRHALRHEKR